MLNSCYKTLNETKGHYIMLKVDIHSEDFFKSQDWPKDITSIFTKQKL